MGDEDEPLAMGVEGEFEMDICNDGSAVLYDMDFKLPKSMESLTSLNYHLHSAYNSEAENGVLGGTGTGGHYDATYKCGGASSNKDSPLCSAPYACSKTDPGECETGDLSGKFGPQEIKNRRVQTRKALVDKKNIARIDDYSPIGNRLNGAAFSSIVFHNPADGNARVFGAQLKPKRNSYTKPGCKATRYYGFLNAHEPIANGVTGKFIMDICNDGSKATYTGDMDLAGLVLGGNTKPDEADGFAFHLHSNYIDVANNGIGAAGTSGHYDPAPSACGPASSNKNRPACDDKGANVSPSAYNCNPNNQAGCELGDLSGKLGKLNFFSDSLKFDIRNDLVPAKNNEFAISRDATDKDGSLFQSVVFHNGDNGQRLFGARLVQDCGDVSMTECFFILKQYK